MNELASTDVIIGVDTHKDVHAAFAINGLGAQLGAMTIPANPKGYVSGALTSPFPIEDEPQE